MFTVPNSINKAVRQFLFISISLKRAFRSFITFLTLYKDIFFAYNSKSATPNGTVLWAQSDETNNSWAKYNRSRRVSSGSVHWTEWSQAENLFTQFFCETATKNDAQTCQVTRYPFGWPLFFASWLLWLTVFCFRYLFCYFHCKFFFNSIIFQYKTFYKKSPSCGCTSQKSLNGSNSPVMYI